MVRVCALQDCSKQFIPKTRNSLYCQKECQRKAALKRYYDNKERFLKKRICIAEGCETILSMYNKEDICEAHKVERYIQRLVGWGWDEESLRKEIS